jgi:hypothetical protein
MTIFAMNITRSDKIDTAGTVSIHGRNFSMYGAYASLFMYLTMQSVGVIRDDVAGRNFTNVELNANVRSTVFIEGFVIFTLDNGTLNCPVELRRTAGNAYQ